jgi:uncharacterized membrane protein
MNRTLWILQALLAALFLFAGGMKLVVPVIPGPFPIEFMRFIGACEVLGAVGLLVPRVSPLAATGLVVIMVGATVTTVSVIPLAVGVVAAFVAWGRVRLVPAARLAKR